MGSYKEVRCIRCQKPMETAYYDSCPYCKAEGYNLNYETIYDCTWKGFRRRPMKVKVSTDIRNFTLSEKMRRMSVWARGIRPYISLTELAGR